MLRAALMSLPPAPQERMRVRIVPYVLTAALLAITAYLAHKGWTFYKLSLEDRPEHPDFRSLRPSGKIGNGYGWVAALLVVMNLSYLIRRRFGRAKLGSMKVWLDIHVFTGLLAAILASFHSAFVLRTPLASATTASLGIVVLTGLLGRFLHTLAPNTDAKRLAYAIDDVETFVTNSKPALIEAIGANPAPNIPANASLIRSVFAIPSWKRAISKRRAAIAAIVGTVAQAKRNKDNHGRGLASALRELDAAVVADSKRSGVTALLRSWRGLHRFFALLMLAAVLLHAGIAWYYGYRWIFE